MLNIDILTLFSEMFSGPFDHSMIKRAREQLLIVLNIIDIRDFSDNKHNTVDDTPYGGGAGMLMSPQPIFKAVEWVREHRGTLGRCVYLSPDGEPLTQSLAEELSRESQLTLICGHYEGIDQRVRDELVTDEITIGDYVLTGGELPAMVLVDTVARLVPGVLGESSSAEEDSFSEGLLEYPQYTRPRVYQGLEVPEVLLNGHHEQIRLWRRRCSLLHTLERRPEILESAELTQEDKIILKQVVLDLEKLGLPEDIGRKKRKNS
ncbi:MAG: tRNA (guanosine(37)-N1)-methyltransferase TrmD [Peptococcaceae bacterium]|nr:tRNA (guanosine(37)-N1)-methyltransferase TrmD [Peptococcaceae bacterium]